MKLTNSTTAELRGKEPKVAPHLLVNDNDAWISKAYSYYNYEHSVADARHWIVEWMKANDYDKDELADFARVSDMDISIGWCATARMLNNGIALPEGIVDRFTANLARVMDNRKDAAISANRAKISPALLIRRSASDHIAFFDEQLDKDKPEANLLKDYVGKLTDAVRKCIADHYKPILNEITAAFNETDEELAESYDHIEPEVLQAKMIWLQKLVATLENTKIVAPATAKPTTAVVLKARIVKEKPVLEIVKEVKFLREFAPMKLRSISPTEIHKATDLWLYNTKYKELTHLVAQTANSLTVKGTTVIGFDPAKSQRRTLRKPEEVLPRVLNNGKVELRTIFNSLSTKPIAVNGRINEDMIIVRSFK